MLCQRCQAEIDTRFPRPDGTIQCPICGLVYQPVVQQPQPAQYPYGYGSQQPSAQKPSSQVTQHRRSAAPAKKKNKIWLAAFAVAVIAALGAGIFFIASGKNGSGALFSAQASSTIVAEHLEDSAIYDGLYDSEEGEYAGADAEKLIPISVYSSVDAYSAGEPIVFNVDILGGTPPFTVNLNIEEGMMNEDGAETDLTRYLEKTNYAGTSASITTSERHLTWRYTPPANGLSLVLYVSVQDAKNCGNLSYNDAIAIKAAIPSVPVKLNADENDSRKNDSVETFSNCEAWIKCIEESFSNMPAETVNFSNRDNKKTVIQISGQTALNASIGTVFGRFYVTTSNGYTGDYCFYKPDLSKPINEVIKKSNLAYVAIAYYGDLQVFGLGAQYAKLVAFDPNTDFSFELEVWDDGSDSTISLNEWAISLFCAQRLNENSFAQVMEISKNNYTQKRKVLDCFYSVTQRKMNIPDNAIELLAEFN